MIEVRPEGCISKTSLDITLNWRDMRNKFRYKKLYVMAARAIELEYLIDETQRLGG